MTDWMKQYPSVWVTRKYDGDKDRAKLFYGEGNKLLYQLKNLMTFRNLGQLKMERSFTDGTVIIAKSVFGHDEVHINCPYVSAEEVVYTPIPLAVIYDRTENKIFFDYIPKTESTDPPLRKYIDLNGIILAPTWDEYDTTTWIGLTFLQPVEYYGEAGVFFYWPIPKIPIIRKNPLIYRYLVKEEKSGGVDVTYEGDIFKQYNFDYDYKDPDVMASTPGNPGIDLINMFKDGAFFKPSGYYHTYEEGEYSGATINYVSADYYIMGALPHYTGGSGLGAITFELACITIHNYRGSISGPDVYTEGNPILTFEKDTYIPFVDIMNEEGAWIAHYNPFRWTQIFFAQGSYRIPLLGGPSSPTLYPDSALYPVNGWTVTGFGTYPEFFPVWNVSSPTIASKSLWWITNTNGDFVSVKIPFSIKSYQWIDIYWTGNVSTLNNNTQLFDSLTNNNDILVNSNLSTLYDYWYPPFQNIGTVNRIAGSVGSFSELPWPNLSAPWPFIWDGVVSVYVISDTIYDPTMTIPVDTDTYPYGKQIKEMSLMKSVYNLDKMPVVNTLIPNIGALGNEETASFTFQMDGYDNRTEISIYYKRSGYSGRDRIPGILSTFAGMPIVVTNL